MIYKVVNSYCPNKAFHQDLVQEIILQLWLAFPKYDNKYKHSTWIYKIALNTAISFFRKDMKEQKHIEQFANISNNIIQPMYVKESDENIKQLNIFIRELKEIDKALILLYLDGISYSEISKIMGISVTNVGTKINRIKKNLADKFNSL